jgi:hypothetical protein
MKGVGDQGLLTKIWNVLTFKQVGWYMNFSAQFIKNILFDQKKIKF